MLGGSEDTSRFHSPQIRFRSSGAASGRTSPSSASFTGAAAAGTGAAAGTPSASFKVSSSTRRSSSRRRWYMASGTESPCGFVIMRREVSASTRRFEAYRIRFCNSASMRINRMTVSGSVRAAISLSSCICSPVASMIASASCSSEDAAIIRFRRNCMKSEMNCPTSAPRPTCFPNSRITAPASPSIMDSVRRANTDVSASPSALSTFS